MKYISENDYYEAGISTKIASSMQKEVLLDKEKTIYRFNTAGYVKNNKDVLSIINMFNYKMLSCSIIKEGCGDRVYGSDTGYLSLSSHGEEHYSIYLYDFDLSKISKLSELLSTLLIEESPVGTVKMLSQTSEGYETSDIGRLQSPLIRENYSPTVLSQYDHLIAEMASSTPCGRFSLLRGEPGTGKSYFLRGLISEVSSVKWLFIPSYLVGSLSGPAMSRVLFQGSEDSDSPLVIILEDADSSVKDRSAGNSDQMADLLNIGDGILGELADIRIIATTNIKTQHIDKALIREGRMCQEVDFEELSTEQWMARWKELTGEEFDGTVSGTRSLATLYRQARDAGWKADERDIVVKSPNRHGGRNIYSPHDGQYL